MRPPYAYLLCALLLSAGVCAFILWSSGPADAEYWDNIQVGDFIFVVYEEYVDDDHPGEVRLVDFMPSEDPAGDVSVPELVTREVGSVTEKYRVTAIDGSVFPEEYCIEALTIPRYVTEIDEIESIACSSFSVAAENTAYESADGILYSHGGTVLVRYPIACGTAVVTIPKEVQTVGSYAFTSCMAAHSVTAAPQSELHQIKNGAFWDCISLVSADFSNCHDLIMIDDEAFFNCVSLENLSLSDSVRLIGAEAFYGTNIASFSITPNITFIDSGAFANCPNLTAFVTENSNYYERDGVLYKMVGSDSQMDELVCYPAGRSAASFVIPDKINHINTQAFTGCVNLTEVTLSKGISVVEDLAFFGCPSLKKVILSESVIVIGWGAFYRCTNLSEVEWNSSLTTIETMAFMDTAFASVVLPDSLATIGVSSFAANPMLTSVTIPEHVRVLESYAFDGCINLKDVTLLGTGIVLENYALSLSDLEDCSVTVHAPLGFKQPSADVGGDHTNIVWDIEGERPYPYENLIGVAICLIVLLGIVRMFRRV